MKDQDMYADELIKAWETNSNHNLLIFKELSDDEMQLASRTKSRTIEKIIKHMVKNKFDWLKHMTPKLDAFSDLSEDLIASEKRTMNWVKELIILETNGQAVKGYKGSLFSFVIYLISHDSHHRGQIFQIMKDNKMKLKPEVQFGIWDWK